MVTCGDIFVHEICDLEHNGAVKIDTPCDETVMPTVCPSQGILLGTECCQGVQAVGENVCGVARWNWYRWLLDISAGEYMADWVGVVNVKFGTELTAVWFESTKFWFTELKKQPWPAGTCCGGMFILSVTGAPTCWLSLSPSMSKSREYSSGLSINPVTPTSNALLLLTVSNVPPFTLAFTVCALLLFKFKKLS